MRNILRFIVKFCLLNMFCGPLWSNSLEPRESYQVALVDRFYPGDGQFQSERDRQLHVALYGMMDIDQDGNKEPIYHGDVVKSILNHPDIDVIHYALRGDKPAIFELLEQLERVRRDIFWEEPISAVLLPWESSTLISSFETHISQRKTDNYLDTLRKWAGTDDVWKATLEIIQVLEDIVDYGGVVYTIAGNGGARMVNTYSFAKGVVTVGAAENDLGHFIAQNRFVDAYASAAYIPERVENDKGEVIGYDIDGDACNDVSLADLQLRSVDLPKRHWKPLIGSSFAAPAALKRYILGYSSRLECY